MVGKRRAERTVWISSQAEAVGGNWMMRCRGFRPGTLSSDLSLCGAVSETNPRASQTQHRAENTINREGENARKEGKTDREEEKTTVSFFSSAKPPGYWCYRRTNLCQEADFQFWRILVIVVPVCVVGSGCGWESRTIPKNSCKRGEVTSIPDLLKNISCFCWRTWSRIQTEKYRYKCSRPNHQGTDSQHSDVLVWPDGHSKRTHARTNLLVAISVIADLRGKKQQMMSPLSFGQTGTKNITIINQWKRVYYQP